MVTNVPLNGELRLNGIALADNQTFTQDDINNSRLSYFHLGSETTTDSFDFELTDGGENSVSPFAGTFNITVTPVNDAPAVSVNNGLTVNEGTSSLITDAMLLEGDPDDSGIDSIYVVTSVPLNGELRLDGTALAVNQTFTQDDINNSRLSYFHLGGEATTDSFDFELTDGGENSVSPFAGTFDITVTPVNDAPAVSVNNGLTVNEGTSSLITDAMLLEGDPDDSGIDSIYVVTSVPLNGELRLDGTALAVNQTFTQDDINNLRLSYFHLGSETTTDSFDFELTDGGENSVSPFAGTFNITVTPVNDAPAVSVNNGLTVNEGTSSLITDAMLLEGDPDDSGIDSIYVVTSVPLNGELRLDGTALAVNQTFTQDDINNSRLSYFHLGGEATTDSFDFELTDGGENSVSPFAGTFDITVTPVNDAPAVSVNNGLTVNEGTSSLITDAMLLEGDPDDSGIDSIYVVTSVPLNGELRLDGTALAVNQTFTQDDINNSRLSYFHLGGEATTDSFDFELTDGGENSVSPFAGTFDITVTPVNDAPFVSVNTGVTVSEGEIDRVIDISMLNALDPDDAPSELTYTLTSPVANGTLTLGGNTIGLDDTFTQEDVTLGLLRYTHDGSETTSDSFAFTLEDGGEDGAAVSVGSFAIAVTPVNDDPFLLTNTGRNVVEGSTGNLITSVILNEGDPDDAPIDVTYTIVDAPTQGTLIVDGMVLSSGGQFTQADINAGLVSYDHGGSSIPSDSITFILSDDDGATSALQTLSIDVIQSNDAPVANDIVVGVADGGTASFGTDRSLVYNDTDQDGDALSVVSVTQGSVGTVTFSANGSFSYTHDGPSAVSDSFTYTISDGNGGLDTAQVTVHIDTDGFVTTDEFRVNIETSDFVDSPLSEEQTTAHELDTFSDSSVASTANGDYVIVWSGSDAAGNQTVYAQRFDFSGAMIGDPINVSSGLPTGDNHSASIAMDDAGNFVVVWTNQTGNTVSADGTPASIYFQRFDASGAMIGGAELVSVGGFSTGSQFNADVSVNSSGAFAITWHGENVDIISDVFVSVYDANGVSALGPQTINDPNGSAHFEINASGVIADDGSVYVVWDDGPNVHARFIDSAGTLGPEFMIPFDLGETDARHASLDFDNTTGMLAVAYQVQIGGQWETRLQIVDPTAPANDATPFANQTSVGDQENPSVSFGDDGTLLLTWEGTGAGDIDGVFGRRFIIATDEFGNSYAQAISDEFLINQTTGNGQQGASVAALDSENFVVVWSGNGPGDADGVFARQFGNQTGYQLTGSVLEDVNGDAQLGDAIGVAGATVYLYLNDSDPAMSSGDERVRTAITDSLGNYTFDGLRSGEEYFVVVDSTTVQRASYRPGFSSLDVWAEQTYGNGGAQFGGANAGVSDDASSLLTSEHFSTVQIAGGDVGDIDFGFSFNVVTNSLGSGDDNNDGIVDGPVQGSLRQFIQNANAIEGSNELRFVPVTNADRVDGTDSYWVVGIREALPTISDEGTFINGLAYAPDGVTPVNYNATTLGYQGSVGVGADGVADTGDENVLDGLDAPDLEIADLNGVGIGLSVEASDTEIAYVAIHGFGNAGDSANIFVGGSGITNVRIHDNVLGATANAFEEANTFGDSTHNIVIRSADSGVIEDNLIGFTRFSGVFLAGGADEWEIIGNEIRSIGEAGSEEDGIDIGNQSSGALVSGNLIEGSAGFGIDTLGSSGNEIFDNTISNNGIGSNEVGGIRLGGDGNSVERNVISDNRGAGVNVIGDFDDGSQTFTASTDNLISRNSFELNDGLAIDLVEATSDPDSLRSGDGHNGSDFQSNATTGNDGIDHPVLTEAFIASDGLHIFGLVDVNQDIDRVEVYFAAPGNGDVDPSGASVGEGSRFLGVLDGTNLISFDPVTGVFESVLATPPEGWASDLLDGSGSITVIGISESNATSEFSANEQINLRPVAEESGVTLLEDGEYVFEVGDFGSSDVNGTNYQQVVITNVPTGGDLFLGSNPDRLVGGETIQRVDIENGLLRYVPQADENGVAYDQLEFQVGDGRLLSDNQAVLVINVDPVNDAPVPQNDVQYEVDEDQTLVVDASEGLLVNDLDIDGDELTVNVDPPTTLLQPAHGTVVFQPDGSLEYIPDANFFGSDTFEYEVTDGNATGIGRVTVTILSVNDDPTITTPNVVPLAENETNVVVLMATDVEVNPVFTYSLTGDGADDEQFRLDAATGQLELVDPANFEAPNDADADGIYEIQVQAVDQDGGVVTKDILVEVTDTPEVPQITTSRFFDVNENETAIGTLLASDPEGGPLTFSIVGGSDATEFVLDEDTGELSFASTHDFENPNSAGGDNIFRVEVRVTDGQGNFSGQSIVVEVGDVNESPTANDDAYTIDEGSITNFDLTSNDTDPDSDQLTITIVEGPQYGTLENENGVVTYSHNGSESQFDSFTYLVTDAGEVTDQATVQITINPVDDPVEVNDDTIISDIPGNITIDPGTLLENDFDPDNLRSEMRVVPTSVENGFITMVDGQLVFTPTGDFPGFGRFSYIVEVNGVASGNEGVVTVFGSVPNVNNASADGSVATEEAAVVEDAIQPTPEGGPKTADQTVEAPVVIPTAIATNFNDLANTQSTDGEEQQSLFSNNSEFVLGESGGGYSYNNRSEEASVISFARAVVATNVNQVSEFETTLLAALAWDDLDNAKHDFIINNLDIGVPKFVASAASLLTVGYLGWIIRGGVLLTTFMSSIPAWSSFDITSVLEAASGDESIEQMVDS